MSKLSASDETRPSLAPAAAAQPADPASSHESHTPLTFTSAVASASASASAAPPPLSLSARAPSSARPGAPPPNDSTRRAPAGHPGASPPAEARAALLRTRRVQLVRGVGRGYVVGEEGEGDRETHPERHNLDETHGVSD